MIAHVFGKEGCSKCAALKRRVEQLTGTAEYAGVKMVYHDVMTLDGIVEFCKADCLNPNRIPALLMSDDEGNYCRSGRRLSSTKAEDFADSVTYQWVGVQTDYDHGGGVITPVMVRDVFEKAAVVCRRDEALPHAGA